MKKSVISSGQDLSFTFKKREKITCLDSLRSLRDSQNIQAESDRRRLCTLPGELSGELSGVSGQISLASLGSSLIIFSSILFFPFLGKK